MRPDLEHIKKIEDFLAKKLPPAEQAQFKKEQQQNPQLQKEVQLQQDLVHQIQEMAFLEEVQAYQQTYNQTRKTKKWWWWLALFVATLLAILVGILFFGSRGEDSVSWFSSLDNETEQSTDGELPNQEGTEPQAKPTTSNTVTADPTNNDLTTTPNKSIRNPFVVPFEQQTINNSKGSTIRIQDSKTVIHIPAKAVLSAAGKSIRGDYTIRYRDFRTPVQLMFSGVPMHQDDSSRYSSNGMLEVIAYQNGQRLTMNPQHLITVDYEVNGYYTPSVDWSLYEDDNKTWKVIESVAMPLPLTAQQKLAAAERAARDRLNKNTATISDSTNIDADKNKIKMGMTLTPINETPDTIASRHFVQHRSNPKLIKGLKMATFGVYNCGNRYTVANQLLVRATYIDAQQNPIEQADILSIIDLDYWAAYSFEPTQFLCNRKAKNIFLLWTKKGDLYSYYSRQPLPKGNTTVNQYTFKMQKLSPKIYSLAALQQYIDKVQEEQN